MQTKSLNILSNIQAIPSGVWAVSISMMLIAASAAMTFSISPLFITKTLGLSCISLGLIEGISEAISNFSKLASGYAGDVFKSKKTPLLIGVIMATISKPIFIMASMVSTVASAQVMIMISKVVERISNGIMGTPRDAYCAEAGHKSIRGASLGLMMSLKMLGCALGSLTIGGIAYYFSKHNYDFDYVFLLWIGFIPCSLSILVLIKYMKEGKTNANINNQKKLKIIKLKDLSLLNKKYWSLLCVSCIFMLARFTDGFLILRMKEIGAPEWLSLMTIGIFNIVGALSCLPIGSLSDKFNRSRILYFSFITLILANFCFMYAQGLMVGILGIVFWGCQRNSSQILFAAIIADEVPNKIIGTALGFYYSLFGLISIVAGFCAGYFADIGGQKNFQNIFIWGSIVSTIAFMALIVRNEFFKHRTKSDNSY